MNASEPVPGHQSTGAANGAQTATQEQVDRKGSLRLQPAQSTSASTSAAPTDHRRKLGKNGKGKNRSKAKTLKRNKGKAADREGGSLEEVMFYEAVALLGQAKVDEMLAGGVTDDGYLERFERFETVELEVVAMSSHGEGLAITEEKDWIVAIPFCVPGERVLAKVYRNDRLHSYADLVEVLRRNAAKEAGWRDDSLIGCKYFGTCGGCQYQFLTYEKQLSLKREVVTKAFKHFSGLDPSLVPGIGETLPSPQQYHYRTKLTPHFDQPTASHRANNGEGLNIGFMQKGRRTVMDIEECPIGTQVINTRMKELREEIRHNLPKYKRGATLLLRDSLPLDVPIVDQVENPPLDVDDTDATTEQHVCVTDPKAIVRERISNKFMFTFLANSFFQNNNGILSSLVDCIRDDLARTRPSRDGEDAAPAKQDRYLVDTYCGSGLFGITLADKFKEVQGIEISADSIKYAEINAKLNGVENAKFLTGSAEAIFENLTLPADQTTILIDPPRKGCDEAFLNQLLAFGPSRIIYVSCNVHTQARDIGYLIKKSEQAYKLDSVRGCDLFPQTYHVEGLAMLSKV